MKTSKYKQQYNKEHYRAFKVDLKRDELELLEKKLKEKGITKAQFLRNAINNFKLGVIMDKEIKELKVGDIFLNPVMLDLWILKKDIFEDEDEESWVLSLVNCDYVEKLENVKNFKKIGNIYDLLQKANKYKEILDKIKETMKEYGKTNVEDYARIIEFCNKINKLLEEIE